MRYSLCEMDITPIAYYHTVLSGKFGIPRQSGLVPELQGEIVFEPDYSNPDALRGIEGFDFLWLVWGFSQIGSGGWRPLVRPPLLGGNRYVGVFATRSPFRPNRLGLSSVRLLSVENRNGAMLLHVAGADLADGTPVYDIKPYVEYSDAHTGVRCGFVDENNWQKLIVDFQEHLRCLFSDDEFAALYRILELDPRPQYHNDPDRMYGMPFAGYDIRFMVSCDDVLRVVDVVKI